MNIFLFEFFTIHSHHHYYYNVLLWKISVEAHRHTMCPRIGRKQWSGGEEDKEEEESKKKLN